MKKMINTTRISGYIYQHSLELKVTGENSKNPGTEFISGNLEIATDNAMLNIVPVHFTYVTATTSKGANNATYAVLKDIIDQKIGTVMEQGQDKAGKVRIDSAIGLNEFYSDRTGKEELVSAKRNEGGFVHMTSQLDEDEKTRDTFTTDIIITNVREIEEDPENNTPHKAIVKGAIFNFRNELMPVEYTVLNPAAIDYFMGLEASDKNPTFTKVWGRQVSTVVVKRTEEESAFGEALVRETKSTRKDFVITGASQEPYEWDSEDTITVNELKEAIANREVALAAIKKRQDEYKASKNAAASSNPVAAPAASAEFKF